MSKVYMISGFLGAGKTTFIKKLVKQFADQRIHLIINEFGKEGVDGELYKDVKATMDEINNGSIFCTCRLEQFETVLAAALKKNPDRIFVEASGLSDPTNVARIFSEKDKFANLDYRGCVTIVDASSFHKVFETASVVKKQLGVSNLILINKADLVTSAEMSRARALAAGCRPDVPIYETTYGEIRKTWIESMAPKMPDGVGPVIQQMDVTLKKFCIHVSDTFTVNGMRRFIEQILPDTYRVKGFVRIEGKIWLLDCVGSMFKMEPYDKEPENINDIIALSGQGMDTRRSIRRAAHLYPEQVLSVE